MSVFAPPQIQRRRTVRPGTIAALSLGAAALTAAHGYVCALPATQPTPLILLDHLFNLALAGLVLAACGALGLRLLRPLGCADLEPLPRALLAVALGLGAVAYCLFGLGVLGLFSPPVLVAAAVTLVAATARDTMALPPRLPEALRNRARAFGEMPGVDRILALLGGAGFLVALAIALAPPTDYDGLMYHLAVPARFLQAGRIYPMPDVIQANFPFTAEMIYSIGLAFGSDSFGRLLNLVLWGLLVAGTWWTGRRYLGSQTGLPAALALLTAPGAYIASSTCVEMLWGLLLLAGVLAFFQYLDRSDTGWLVLMGILSGLVLGTKQLAAGVPLMLGCGIAAHLLFSRRVGLLEMVRPLALFCATTLLVASPWYLKNWLWLGSPLYPLHTDAGAWADFYLTTAGTPKTILNLIALPLAIFFPPEEWTFSAALPSHFFLSYLFLALPAVLLAPSHRHVRYLLLFAALFFATWAAGYQMVRFLYPVFPLLSLLVAHALVAAGWRGKHLPPNWPSWLLAPFLGLSLAIQLLLLIAVSPLGAIAGVESRDGFLVRSQAVWTYSAVRWANQHLPKGSKLFMVGSGQGYYFRDEVLPDSTAGNLDGLFSRATTPEEALRMLRDGGFTHIFYSEADMQWHLQHRDPDGRLHRQVALLEELLGNSPTLLYRDDKVRIYRLE